MTHSYTQSSTRISHRLLGAILMCWRGDRQIRTTWVLNADKTKAIVTGTRQQVAKFNLSGSFLVSGVTVPFIAKQRVLDATLDSHLFDEHITGVVRDCNYHMRALRHICPVIYLDTGKHRCVLHRLHETGLACCSEVQDANCFKSVLGCRSEHMERLAD